MQHPTRFILNPADSHHRLGVAWQRCQRECLRRLQPSEVTIVESAPEAAQEAWQAAMDGTVRIIVVGSAATANGVVNGLMRLAPSHRRLVRLGFLAPLRPTEWGRTTGFPRRLSRQLEVLHDAEVLPFDLGRMTPGLGQAAGAPHYFLNGASFGMTSEIRDAFGRNGGHWGEAMRQVCSSLGRFLFDQRARARIDDEDGVLYQGPWLMGMVMVGRYYPGIGDAAPDADPRDGRLDLVWMDARTRRDKWQQVSTYLLRRNPRVLAHTQGRSFRAVNLNVPMHVEVDGVSAGMLPASFDVEPQALSIIVPQAVARQRRPRFAALPELRDGHLAGGLGGATRLAS